MHVLLQLGPDMDSVEGRTDISVFINAMTICLTFVFNIRFRHNFRFRTIEIS